MGIERERLRTVEQEKSRKIVNSSSAESGGSVGGAGLCEQERADCGGCMWLLVE